MTATTATDVDAKLRALETSIGSMGRVLVAYSGGVDSAMLAVAAHRVLGDNAVAVTADSESYARGELETAAAIAQQFGIEHRVVRTRELDNPDYASNPTNRCYYCKHELFTRLKSIAAKEGVECILYGQNADDVGDYRPGSQAATELGARAPLQEAGMTKEDVRALARRWNIPVWDRPATACLSSRFPYGTPVTAPGLRMVDDAERLLRERGFTQLRVRHHDDIARVELTPEEMPRVLTDEALRRDIGRELAGLGYALTVLDLRGYRTGSMNEVLAGADTTLVDIDTGPVTAAADAGPADDSFTTETRGPIMVVRLPADSIARLADASHRAELARGLATAPEVHYVALELNNAG